MLVSIQSLLHKFEYELTRSGGHRLRDWRQVRRQGSNISIPEEITVRFRDLARMHDAEEPTFDKF